MDKLGMKKRRSVRDRNLTATSPVIKETNLPLSFFILVVLAISFAAAISLYRWTCITLNTCCADSCFRRVFFSFCHCGSPPNNRMSIIS